MKLETLLPLGKIDPGLPEPGTPFDIHRVAEGARLVESLGYDNLCADTGLARLSPPMVAALWHMNLSICRARNAVRRCRLAHLTSPALRQLRA